MSTVFFLIFLRVGHTFDKPVVDYVRRIVIFYFIEKCLRSVDYLDGSCELVELSSKTSVNNIEAPGALSSRLDSLGLRRSRTQLIK